MDAHITAAQAAAIFAGERVARIGLYTDIPGNFYSPDRQYHYSWQGTNQIVVGVGLGPGFHRNFTCTISNQFNVALTAGGGRLQVAGINGINTVALLTSVTRALKLRFRTLIPMIGFNSIGRTPLQVTFQNNEMVNRHDHKKIAIDWHRIDGQVSTAVIDPGRPRIFVNGAMRGFAVFQNLPAHETYYRNYDVRENVQAGDGGRLRVLQVLHGNLVTLTGTGVSGNITVVEL